MNTLMNVYTSFSVDDKQPCSFLIALFAYCSLDRGPLYSTGILASGRDYVEPSNDSLLPSALDIRKPRPEKKYLQN